MGVKIERALTANTLAIFEQVSELECIKGLYLCGGTALSLMLGHRKSEDLDFELLGIRKERPALSFSSIIKEISEKFQVQGREILGEDHFQLFIEGNVKLSFFRPKDSVPSLGRGYVYHNIVTPARQELLGMKIFTTTVRSEFRDYYDIYSLLRTGCRFTDGLSYALRFARYSVKSKTVVSNLLADNLYVKPSGFQQLDPIYDISPTDIRDYIKDSIEREMNGQGRKE